MTVPAHAKRIMGWLRHRFPTARIDGVQWIIPCPFCGKTNHCTVNPWKNKYYCFRCGAGRGTTVTAMIRDIEQNTSREELDRMFTTENTELFQPLQDRVPTAFKGAVLPKEYQPIFPLLRDADKSPLLARAIAYLRRRRITDAMMIHYRIGVCFEGKYARRIIVPIVLNGEAVSFVARLFLAPGMRYLTPPREEIKIPPTELLFNWDVAKDANPIKIAEGVFDAMALGPSATSLLGKNLHQGQRIQFELVMPRAIEIWLDPDAWKDALQLMETFRQMNATVTLMQLHDGDPSETGGLGATSYEITTLAQSFKLRWKSNGTVAF